MKETVFISLMTDFGFKRVFGTEANKDLLIHFLNCLLEHDNVVIADIQYLNKEFLPETKKEKRIVLDLICKDQLGKIFVVEVQLAPQIHFADRILYYAARIISSQILKGTKIEELNYELKPLYLITITPFSVNPSQNVINHYKLIDVNNREVFNHKLNIINVQLNNFKKNEEELTTDLEKWLYLLKKIDQLEKIPKNFRGYIFERLFQITEYHALDRIEQRKYLKTFEDMGVWENAIAYAVNKALDEKQKEFELILQEEKRKAEEKEKKLVYTLHELGLSLEQIAEKSQLSIEQVQSILNSKR